MVSVLIPTKNEEKDLPGCLQSVSWCDDIHVLDSGSKDSTVEIAKGAKANVTASPHTSGSSLFGGNEAEHKNWALRNIAFKYSWVLHIDADERPSKQLVENIGKVLQDPGLNVAFQLQRRDFYLGTWLKHVQATPFYIRLFRPEKMRYERLINPVSIPDGPVGQVSGFLDHFPFSKGVQAWLDRHNSYSSLEAQQIVANRARNQSFSLIGALTARDFVKRRYHQKELFYRLPARPLVKFAVLYFLKRGFLDGRAGFTYAVLQAMYEYLIVLKTHEGGEFWSSPQYDIVPSLIDIHGATYTTPRGEHANNG